MMSIELEQNAQGGAEHNIGYLNGLPEVENRFGVILGEGEKVVFAEKLSTFGNEQDQLLGRDCAFTLTNQRMITDNGLGTWEADLREDLIAFSKVEGKGGFLKSTYFAADLNKVITYEGGSHRMKGFHFYFGKAEMEKLEAILCRVFPNGEGTASGVAPQMRKGESPPANKKLIPSLIALAALVAVLFFMPRLMSAGSAISITMNDKEYTMCELSLREFLQDGYRLSVMTTSGKEVWFHNYNDVTLDAKTEYSTGVALRVGDSAGSQINVWLYNPKPKPVEIREGMIRSIACDLTKLTAQGVTVAVAGLTLDGQSKEAISTWAEQVLKGFKKSENENMNAISYGKSGGSYTFVFDESDRLIKAVVSKQV